MGDGVGVRVTSEGPGLALPGSLSGFTGTIDGDNVDWEDGGGAPGTVPGSTDDFELKNEGGQSFIEDHGAMGTTETFDPTDGNVHTGTLDDDCTITLGAPVGTGACLLELRITGDGTNTWTWPGSVTWLGSTPDPPGDSETAVVLVESLDGGTTWLGVGLGGPSSGRWELAVIPGSPPDPLYADGDFLYIFVP